MIEFTSWFVVKRRLREDISIFSVDIEGKNPASLAPINGSIILSVRPKTRGACDGETKNFPEWLRSDGGGGGKPSSVLKYQ